MMHVWRQLNQSISYFNSNLAAREPDSKWYAVEIIDKNSIRNQQCAYCLSAAYIEPKSRTERRRKTKIGTEVAHVTRDSDTTFKIKRSKVNLRGWGGDILQRPSAQLVLFRPGCSSLLGRNVGCRMVVARTDYSWTAVERPSNRSRNQRLEASDLLRSLLRPRQTWWNLYGRAQTSLSFVLLVGHAQRLPDSAIRQCACAVQVPPRTLMSINTVPCPRCDEQ